jgi:membrane protein YdbS with pleckstrin-like domain
MGYAEKNLAPGETILFRAHYHWLVYRTGLLLLLLSCLVGAGSFYAHRTNADSGVAGPTSFLALGFLLLAGGALAWRRIRVAADVFVVTNHRVIRKVGLLAREIQQAPLDKIQDITIEQGLLGRLLDYGTVVLETAAEHGSLVFPLIAHPESFRNQLWGQGPRPGAPAPASAPPASQARERLAELEKLRQAGLVTEAEYAARRKAIVESI